MGTKKVLLVTKVPNNHNLSQSQQQTQASNIQQEGISRNRNLPYVIGTTEKLPRIVRTHNIRSTFYTKNTFRKLFCKPKDREATEDKNNLDYVTVKQFTLVNLNGL